MTAQCQAQHGLRADRFQAYFLARKVRRNYFPHVSTVMWPTPVRIVLNLLADLCAMLTHQYGHTAEEVEARIDRLSSPLQSQITDYHRQQDQGG